jgi:ABC-type uncharacterized transport system substrate-binding protein
VKRFVFLTLTLFLFVIFLSPVAAQDFAGKKVLFVDSYHEGYAWSDGILAGIEKVIGPSGAELKVVHMDTKRNASDEFKKEAAEKAKGVIDEYQPDVVIAADDNASKYLVEPHYKNADLPFVFCGVNWDASVYGYPYDNATGMVEVTPVDGLLDVLYQSSQGQKVGFLGPDITTAHKEADNIKKVFDLELTEYYAKDADDWMKGFETLQGQADVILIDSDGGLYEERQEEMVDFVLANTQVPTGTSYDFMAPLALICYGKVAEEQGEWSAETALKILGGASPADIPITNNEKGKLIINAKIAEAAGIEVPYEVIESAEEIIE